MCASVTELVFCGSKVLQEVPACYCDWGMVGWIQSLDFPIERRNALWRTLGVTLSSFVAGPTSVTLCQMFCLSIAGQHSSFCAQRWHHHRKGKGDLCHLAVVKSALMHKCSILDSSDRAWCFPFAQNPDPEAAIYFAEYIVKAYKTLTDSEAYERWQRDGHPDGPRVGARHKQLFLLLHFSGIRFTFLLWSPVALAKTEYDLSEELLLNADNWNLYWMISMLVHSLQLARRCMASAPPNIASTICSLSL